MVKFFVIVLDRFNPLRGKGPLGVVLCLGATSPSFIYMKEGSGNKCKATTNTTTGYLPRSGIRYLPLPPVIYMKAGSGNKKTISLTGKIFLIIFDINV